ncbi:hypothetical protein TRAPUB_9619 [Trametes pubescens]|uniref:Uncharacterized protein n=1 Tax=Trametes pubescens TaxID=154538 RepID=A0A1M2W1W0_TRAPU|nr:hypothetical protein TRAPUB_9619 [Trametes pubescens]
MSPQLVYIQDEGEDYKSKRLLLEAVEDVLAPVPGQSSNSAREKSTITDPGCELDGPRGPRQGAVSMAE